MGIVYAQQGKYELAIASYQQAIDLDPKDANFYSGLILVYSRQGNYELAVASYQQVIDLNLNCSNGEYLHNALGNAYSYQGKYELAISSYQQSIDLNPKFAYPKLRLGFVKGLQGNQIEAINLWEQGLKVLTDNDADDRLFRTLVEVGIGEIEHGTNRLREILETEKPSLGILSEVLKSAELISRFPTKLKGIDTVVEMLRQAIEKAQ